MFFQKRFFQKHVKTNVFRKKVIKKAMGQAHGAFGYSPEKSELDSEQSILSTVQYFRIER